MDRSLVQETGRALVLAAGLAIAPPGAQAAQTTLFQLGPSEVMVSACAGLQTGNGWSPGGSVSMIDARSTCESGTTVEPAGEVSRSVVYDESPTAVQASSQGQARFGQIRLASAFAADTANGLSMGVVNAGWNATMTVLPFDPADIGKAALYTFGIHVDGLLAGAGFGNSGAGLSLWALVDDGFTGASWSASGQGVLFQPYHQVLDEDIEFSLPITLGTPFKLGFFAATWSGNASGFGGASQASTDLWNTITWNGVRAVTVAGVPIDHALDSSNGIDWRLPFAAADPQAVPLPSTLLLAAAGVLLARGRRRIARPAVASG